MTIKTPLSFTDAAKQEMEHYHFLADLHVQPKWDIPSRIAINVAVSGRASGGSSGVNAGEASPQSVEDHIEAAAGVIAAGATGIHLDFTLVTDRHGRPWTRVKSPWWTCIEWCSGPCARGVNIRVGLEDTMWRYPNSDEQFASNVEMFQKARTIAELHGRQVATAAEYRADLGVRYQYRNG